MSKRIVVNVGCGSDIKENTEHNHLINLDLTPPYDIAGDVFHLPFKEASVDTILVFNLMEHLLEIQSVKQEFARVLKLNSAFIQVIVPHYTAPNAWGDPTHVRCFSSQSFFNYLWPGFEVVNAEMIYMKNPPGWKPLRGLAINSEPESKALHVILARIPLPYNIVKRAYKISHIKMGQGDESKSNSYHMYDEV